MFSKKINAASIASGIDSITKQFTIMVDSLKQKSEEAIALKTEKEIIDKLQILYNKERQAAITQEITEIVSGANSQE